MVEERRHGVVHQRVSLDEVQVRVVQLLAVVRTRPCERRAHVKRLST